MEQQFNQEASPQNRYCNKVKSEEAVSERIKIIETEYKCNNPPSKRAKN